MATSQITGPIPGENYTSDTKNYPWHRPPEYTNLDKAIEAIGKKLLSEEASAGILTMMKMGISVAALVDAFLTSGIGAGKWTPDFALMLAGPTSHIMCLMAEGYGVDYDLGIEDKRPRPTTAFFKKVEREQRAVDIIKKNIPTLELSNPKSSGGFMAGPPMQMQEPTAPMTPMNEEGMM